MESGVLSASIIAQAKNSWTLVSDSTDFASLSLNKKKFSCKAGTVDLSSASKSLGNINPSSFSTAVTFTGHTGLASTAQSGQAGEIVATITLN